MRRLCSVRWKGKWEGGDGGSYEYDKQPPPLAKGPIISIRHPLSTNENPRQDIPIMVFTMAQWRLVEEDKMILSAAPVGPGELGRDEKYVFALPARFNYADVDGREEVDDIISSHPLRPFRPSSH